MNNLYRVTEITRNNRITQLRVCNDEQTVAIVHVRNPGDLEAARLIAKRCALQMTGNGYIEVDS